MKVISVLVTSDVVTQASDLGASSDKGAPAEKCKPKGDFRINWDRRVAIVQCWIAVLDLCATGSNSILDPINAALAIFFFLEDMC